MFQSIGGGSAILETFGYLMGVAVVVPLKLLVTQVQLSVDALTGFIDVGKRVANFFGGDFQLDPNGVFGTFGKNLEANGKSILNTLLGQDAKVLADQVNFSQIEVYQSVLGRQQDFFDKSQAAQTKASKVASDAAATNDLESLKAQEARIRAALALVEAGSAEELRLKKLLVVTKRDIDLLGEKKTEGDRLVIKAEALRDLRQLQDEYDKKQSEAAKKAAAEQAEVQKKIADLKAGLLQDETERRVQQLLAAADKEKATAKGTAEQIAEQTSTAIQTVADFEKIGSDKQLAKLDKEKAARLAKLEAEYKAGTVSKEVYEAQKASIEQNYDEQTRQIKKRAAEKEKELNIAQAIIQTALSVVKASPNVPLMVAAGITGAASVAKIIATPIPEFEQGVGGPKPTWREKARQFTNGGRINARAGVGQRHSGGGIQMVDGATGEHLGEWERGEPYLILSRDTYANNKQLVDELIDTSLYRGGAPVRQRADYFEEGGMFTPGSAASATPTVAGASASSQELVQLVRETRDAVRALPSWVKAVVEWNQGDTLALEQELEDLADDRNRGQIK